MIPLQEARSLIRKLEEKKKVEYEITPKIKQAIRRDSTKFKKEILGTKKIDKPKVVQAVKDIFSLLMGPESSVVPTILWASELKPKDMLSHSFDPHTIQGTLGQKWGSINNFSSVVSAISYPIWGQKKWDGNADDDLCDEQNVISRLVGSYRNRVEGLVNDSKILSGHMYRMRLRAPKNPNPAPPSSHHYWYGRRYTDDYFRSMMPVNMSESYKAWVIGKHFVENTDLLEYANVAKLIATSLYCIYLRGNHLILVEKPEIHLEDDPRGWGHRLHNDSGPAVYFPELKRPIYCLHGVKVPKEIVTTPTEKLNPMMMTETRNAEVRRELVRKLGIDRIFSALGAITLDKSADGVYELVNLNVGDTRTRPYLKMLNPSIGTWHFEGVRPGCTTVAEALTFRNGTAEIPEVLT